MPFPTAPLKAAARASSPKTIHNAALKASPAAAAAATAKDTTSNPPTFLRYIFQPNPSFQNCCTHETTSFYLSAPSHPNHIRTLRRAEAFDPNVLHWSVTAHTDVSKKRTVRSWAKRRVHAAFREELRRNGYGGDGRVLRDAEAPLDRGGHEAVPERALSGALRIFMAVDDRKKVVTVTGEEVKEMVKVILRNVIRRQAEKSEGRPQRGPRQERRSSQRRPPWKQRATPR